MDVLGRIARELSGPAPAISQRIQWERRRRHYPAPRTVVDLLPRGGCGIDVGAAQGLFTVGMLAAVKASGSVYAFEPDPHQAASLHKMARTRRRLHFYEVALSDRDGLSELRIPRFDGNPNRGMGSLRHRPATPEVACDTVKVRTMRLDTLLSELPRVDLMKVDVEGHEDEVLTGASQLLDRDRPTLIVEIEQRHRGADPRTAVEQLVSRYAYDAWAVFPDGLRPASDFNLERDQLQYTHRGDEQAMPVSYVHDFVFTRRK